MSVVNGFIIAFMFFLLVYMFYRLFVKKNLLLLIPICAQIFSLAIAILSFVNNVEALQAIQAAYILLGILPAVIFLITDYVRMIGKVKSQGVFEGLVEQPVLPDTNTAWLPAEGINKLAGAKQLSDIMKSLKDLPDDMQRNFKKCLSNANLLLDEENYTGSFYIYDTLSKTADCSYMLYYNTAGICYLQKRYDEALKGYKRALEISGHTAAEQQDIYYNMGNTYYMLGRPDKAAGSFEKAIELNPGYLDAIENLAFSYVQLGDTDHAIELLRNCVVQEGNGRTHFISGKLLHEAGRYFDAEEELQKCIKAQPGSIEAREELGKVLLKQNKQEDALKAFDDILRLDAGNYSAWCNKGKTLSVLSRWKEAASCYKEAVKIKPDCSTSYYNMAVALDECGNRKAAVEAYHTAIRLCPDLTEAYNNLGITLSLMGRFEDALEVYHEGISRNPQDFSLFFNMGMNLFETGRYMEAAAAYRNALDIKPGELEIYYYLGAALTEMRYYNDAIDAYRSALKIKPSDGELHYNIAAIYAMLGRYDIAGENLKRAIELNEEVRRDVIENRAFDGMRSRNDYRDMMSAG